MVKRVLVAVLILAFLVAGGVYAYPILMADSSGPRGPVYATASVIRGDLRVSVDGFGNLEPIWSSDIQTEAGGFLESLTIKQGDEVYEGQIVGRLRNEQLTLQYRQLELELNRSKARLASVLGVPEDRVLEADPNRGISIVAPINGRVTELNVEPGQTIERASVIARIVDDSRVVILAELRPGEFALVDEGMEVTLRLTDFSDLLPGVIVDANPVPIPKDNRYIHMVRIEAANPGLLRPGHEVQIMIREQVSVSAVIDRYFDETVVWSSADGNVVEVPVRAWQDIRQGEVLARLGGVETNQFINEQQLAIRELQENLVQKATEMEQLVIRSPIDGVVAWAQEYYGWELHPGASIASIINNTKMGLRISVDEIDIIHIESGMEAAVTVDAFPGDVFPASVKMVDLMGSDKEGVTVYNVFLEVEQTKKIRPGMTANVSIFINESSSTLLIPIEAVYQEEGAAKVDILENGRPIPRVVRLGFISSRYAEVLEGLEEGELVVTGSSGDLLDSEYVETPGQPWIPSPDRPEIKPEPMPEPRVEVR